MPSTQAANFSAFDQSYCTVCECLITCQSEASLYCSRACRKADAKHVFSMAPEEVQSTFRRTKSATSLTLFAEQFVQADSPDGKRMGEVRPPRVLLTPLQPSRFYGKEERMAEEVTTMTVPSSWSIPRPKLPARHSYGQSVPRSIDLVMPDPQSMPLARTTGFSAAIKKPGDGERARITQEPKHFMRALTPARIEGGDVRGSGERL